MNNELFKCALEIMLISETNNNKYKDRLKQLCADILYKLTFDDIVSYEKKYFIVDSIASILLQEDIDEETMFSAHEIIYELSLTPMKREQYQQVMGGDVVDEDDLAREIEKRNLREYFKNLCVKYNSWRKRRYMS